MHAEIIESIFLPMQINFKEADFNNLWKTKNDFNNLEKEWRLTPLLGLYVKINNKYSWQTASYLEKLYLNTQGRWQGLPGCGLPDP